MDHYHLLILSGLFVLSQSCAPGLSQKKDQQSCSCIESSYNSLITCNISKPTIIRGGWIGNYSGEIVAGATLYLYSMPTNGVALPANWSEVDQTLCGELHRRGVLCGDCLEGYGPTTDAYFYLCVTCSDKNSRFNWLWYILLEYVPLTVLFFILVVFNVDATSGAGNAFIFFAQMVTTVFDIFEDNIIPLNVITHNHTHAIRTLYQLPYGMWNMEFFTLLAPPFCLSHKIGTYGVILVNYAIALYPMVLIFLVSFIVWLNGKGLSALVLLCKPIYRCILRVQKKWQFRRSMLGVFATFITLSYTKMLSTSVKLIMPTTLYYSSDRVAHSNIPAYNGNKKFTDPGLIIMYISAIVVLFVYIAVLPCLLVTPSVVKALHHRTKWEWLTKILPWGRMQEFLEGFHSCYVVGSFTQVDYRWFSGLFLALRGAFFLTVAFSPSRMEAYMFLGALCFITMFVITWTRPFKVKHHNTLNVGVFCILGLISCINTFNSYRTIMWLPVWPTLFWFEYMLVFLPLFILIVSSIKWFRRRIKTTPTTNNYFEEPSDQESKELPLMEDDPSNFLMFAEKNGRLKSNNRDVTWYISSRSYDDDNNSIASTIQDYRSINN